MIEKLIDKTKSEDLLLLSGIIINLMKTDNKLGSHNYDILPELFTTMGIDNTINLIKYFGGETITIPSHEEMYTAFLIIICYYRKNVQGVSWEAIQEELKIDVSPHMLGKIISYIDERISLSIDDIKKFGIEKYIDQIKSLNKKKEETVKK